MTNASDTLAYNTQTSVSSGVRWRFFISSSVLVVTYSLLIFFTKLMNEYQSKTYLVLKVALCQKVLEDFYFSKKIFQISILRRKFE